MIVEVDQNMVNDPQYRNESWGVGELSRQSILGVAKATNGWGGATNKGVVSELVGNAIGAGVETSHIDYVIPAAALVKGAKLMAYALFTDSGAGSGDWTSEARFGVQSTALASRISLFGGPSRVLAITTLVKLTVELLVTEEGSVGIGRYINKSEFLLSSGTYPLPEVGTQKGKWTGISTNTQQDHILSFTSISGGGGATDVVSMLDSRLVIWRP